jgi:hypothetical protein
MGKSTLAILATIFAAVTLAALPLSKALAVCEECVPPPQPPPNNPTSSSTHSSSNAGPWVVGCTMLSAGALIVGTVAQANDRRDPRQLTPTEAAWLAAVCPGFLPIALLNQTTCPDNRATYRIARLAYRFLRRHPQGDQTPFVNAYTEACRTGRLTRETRIQLRSLIR